MNNDELEKLIAKSLKDFYDRRINCLEELQLERFLKRKNPYLLRAIGMERASEIVESILNAHLSASDETIFGDAFFEPIATIVSGGKVSDAEGVDFTIEQTDRYKAVSLKSGPNIFNSSQKKKQNEQFLSLKSRLYKIHKQFDPILGHAYGRLNKDASDKQIYRDVSGQKFWEELTGDSDFYLKLVELMKNEPQKHKQKFNEEWGKAINKFTKKFIETFCHDDGSINWDKITKLVSEDSNNRKDGRLF